jgi:hypothetical protein
MRYSPRVRWGGRLLAAALVAVAAIAAACGRPPDESWLEFLGFRASGATTTLTSIEGDLNDGKTDKADAAFRNDSFTVGPNSGSSTGTGILIKSAHVDYQLSGFSPPSYDYPQSLFLGASGVSSGVTTTTEGTLTDFPLAPASLKRWLLDTHAFDASGGTSPIRLTAKAKFNAVTDDGNDLEVNGSITVVLSNGGTAASPQTVNIDATTPTAQTSADGAFTVSRTGPTTSELTVHYSVGGTATGGTDYVVLEGFVAIAAGSSSATIPVTPLSGYAVNSTVIVTLGSDSSYTVGSRNKATVTLI